MVRTQIQLTEEQANSLKKMALSRHLSMAELIRQALDTMIKSATAIDMEEKRERALAIAGRFHSGKGDISEKHDKYLSDAYKA